MVPARSDSDDDIPEDGDTLPGAAAPVVVARLGCGLGCDCGLVVRLPTPVVGGVPEAVPVRMLLAGGADGVLAGGADGVLGGEPA